MNTLNLQGEQLELFNQIAGLDNESFAKVKRYVKKVIHDHQQGKAEKKIDAITDDEIEDAMRPYSYEEKLERLKASEADPVVYRHDDVKKMSLEWLK